MLDAQNLGRLERNLELSAGWMPFKLHAESTGGLIQLVIAHAEFLGQVGLQEPVSESVAQCPDLGEPSPPATAPAAVGDDHAPQGAVAHPSPRRPGRDL